MLPSLWRVNDQPPASFRAYWNLSLFGRFFLVLLIIFNRLFSSRIGWGLTVHHLTCDILARTLDMPHTHAHTHTCTHARFPTLTDGSLAQITHPMPPPTTTHHCRFCYKKRRHWTEKNLPRKKIARYKGRNSPRERTMITTGWEWRWITLGNETDVFRSQSMAWMVILPYCGGNFTFFFRVMFASVRYVSWTVTNSLPLHTRCIPKVNPARNYH